MTIHILFLITLLWTSKKSYFGCFQLIAAKQKSPQLKKAIAKLKLFASKLDQLKAGGTCPKPPPPQKVEIKPAVIQDNGDYYANYPLQKKYCVKCSSRLPPCIRSGQFCGLQAMYPQVHAAAAKRINAF
jgi:hypothetical protein